VQIQLNPPCFEGVDQSQVPEGSTGFPTTMTTDRRLSLGGVGLLMELISRGGDFDIEDAKRAELERRATGLDPEDVDALLAEIEAAGYIVLPRR
jgi:hypothetical protein